MNIDANTPERDVLIAYLENSGVSQQKEAAKEMKKMMAEANNYKRHIFHLECLIAEEK